MRWADQALALADELDCPKVRPRALVNKGSALADLPGRVSEGIAVLEQALAEAKATGDAWNQARALNNLLNPGARIWPLARIQAALDEVRELSWQTGQEGTTMALWANRSSQLAWLRGDMEQVREHLAEARRLDLAGRDSNEYWWYLRREVELAIEADDTTLAASLLAEADQATLDAELRVVFSEPGRPAGRGRGGHRRGRRPADEGDRAIRGPLRPRPGAGADRGRHRPAGRGRARGGAQARWRRLDEHTPDWSDESPSLRRHVDAALLEAEGRAAEAIDAYREALADPHRLPPGDHGRRRRAGPGPLPAGPGP